MTHHALLCQSCITPKDALDLPTLQSALADIPDVHAHYVDCMSGCTRAATIAFRAPGKTAYLFGDISRADLPDLITFARAYVGSPDGTLEDARILGGLRHKAIARIPGV